MSSIHSDGQNWERNLGACWMSFFCVSVYMLQGGVGAGERCGVEKS